MLPLYSYKCHLWTVNSNLKYALPVYLYLNFVILGRLFECKVFILYCLNIYFIYPSKNSYSKVIYKYCFWKYFLNILQFRSILFNLCCHRTLNVLLFHSTMILWRGHLLMAFMHLLEWKFMGAHLSSVFTTFQGQKQPWYVYIIVVLVSYLPVYAKITDVPNMNVNANITNKY